MDSLNFATEAGGTHYGVIGWERHPYASEIKAVSAAEDKAVKGRLVDDYRNAFHSTVIDVLVASWWKWDLRFNLQIQIYF